MPTIDMPEPAATGESLDLALQRVASELITALDLHSQAEATGLDIRDIVSRSRLDVDLSSGSPEDLAMSALDSALSALEVLGQPPLETMAYCVEVDPPSPYFRLGGVETCSHRPDHPRILN